MKRLWSNSLINKFFLSYLVIIGLLFLCFYYYSGSVLKEFYIHLLSDKLQEEATMLSRLLPDSLEGASLDRLTRDLTQERKLRITVIGLDGKVLGDSQESSQNMENHGSRPEVRDALSKGQGSSLRYSTTVGHELFYVAFRPRTQGRSRILRLSIPVDSIEETLSSLRHAILLGLAMVSAIGLLLAFFFSRRLGIRVKRMAEFSRQVSTAHFPEQSMTVQGTDEFSTLEKNLNQMSRNIQEQIQTILSEKEKVESILRCMSEGVLVVDAHGRLILLNDNARRMFKLSPTASLNGVSLMEISRRPDMKKLIEEVFACDCTTQCFSKEISIDEGKCFRVNAVSLMSGDGRPLGYVLVFHDVTELKRLEHIRADFVANVSHELRTPLAAIRGYVETLLRTPPKDPETAYQFLEIINRHSERLGRLIDDLLTLSDLESGKAQLKKEAVQTDALIRGALEIFRGHAEQKGIQLAYMVEAGLPPICGDPDRLQQLLINLIDNALKYTPAQGIVKVEAHRTTQTNTCLPMIQITVSDTGAGIPAKDIPRLTERFYTVDKARSRELGGTGLGLAIVKHILQAHGGSLEIDSQMHRGTTVRVFLPPAESLDRFTNIIFLCTANSCRSQIAEGFARHLRSSPFQVLSAGTHPSRVHPLAIKVMAEVGIDISTQRSKGVDEIPWGEADLVITLCEDAAESCPALPVRAQRLHWPIPNPALAEGDEAQVLQAFRHARDDIRSRIQRLLS